MTIRRLDRNTDLELTAGLFQRAADYTKLELGQDPTPETATGFFADAPPDIDPATCLHLGSFQRHTLIGLAGVSFGYPLATDAYIGLMLFDPAFRGQGQGKRLLDHVVTETKARGATRLLVAVLDENTAGRAFWNAMGFTLEQTFPPSQLGHKTHIRHRMTRVL